MVVESRMQKTITILGYGYVSRFLAKELHNLGWTVFSTSRKVEPGNPIKDGYATIINFFDDNLASLITSSNVLLSTIPPEEEITDPALQRYGHLISRQKFDWVGYLSSTSVYGDHNGEWVDELTKCEPSNPKSEKRLAAENLWLNLYSKHDLPVHIFRLSGIYGPQRNCLEEISNGKNFTLLKENQFFSRIHIDDICHVLLKSITHPTPGEIYNLSDNEPCQTHIVNQYGAELLGRKPLREVPIEDAVLSEQAKFFFQDNKKVRNQKIVEKLNIRFRYPTYRSGLSQGCLSSIKD